MVSLLASHLDLSHFDLRVFCIYGDPQGNIMEQAVLDHGVSITYIRKGLGFSIRYFVKLWNELSRFDPDVVHTHLNACMYCAPWAVVHKIKMLHTIHNVPEREAPSKLRRSLMRLLYSCDRAIPVAISELNRRLISEFYSLPLSRVEMIVNPVDVANFRGLYQKPLSARAYDFISVARLEPQKNHKGLIEAFAALVKEKSCSGLVLALVGSGPLCEEIEEQINKLELKDNVAMLGKRDDIANLMCDSRCFVLASDYEGLPMAVLEAMAAGLPIVATAVGGVPDVINLNGVLVEPRDVEALTGAMRLVLEDASEWEKMSEQSRNLSQQYDVGSVAGRYGNLYARYSQ